MPHRAAWQLPVQHSHTGHVCLPHDDGGSEACGPSNEVLFPKCLFTLAPSGNGGDGQGDACAGSEERPFLLAQHNLGLTTQMSAVQTLYFVYFVTQKAQANCPAAHR